MLTTLLTSAPARSPTSSAPPSTTPCCTCRTTVLKDGDLVSPRSLPSPWTAGWLIPPSASWSAMIRIPKTCASSKCTEVAPPPPSTWAKPGEPSRRHLQHHRRHRARIRLPDQPRVRRPRRGLHHARRPARAERRPRPPRLKLREGLVIATEAAHENEGIHSHG